MLDAPGLQDGKNETWLEQDVADMVAAHLRHHPASTVHARPCTACAVRQHVRLAGDML